MYVRDRKEKNSIVVFPDVKWEYCYSAKRLQMKLNSLLAGQRVMGIYVELFGYLESFHWGRDYIDLSYLGGTTFIVFDKTVLQLAIHVEGMIEYRVFPASELTIQEKFDYAPDDMVLSGKYFFNVANHDVTYEYEGTRVTGVVIKRTDDWLFSLSGFDGSLAAVAAKKNDLPSEITIMTDECKIKFLGDVIEYYWVLFENPLSQQDRTPADYLLASLKGYSDERNWEISL